MHIDYKQLYGCQWYILNLIMWRSDSTRLHGLTQMNLYDYKCGDGCQRCPRGLDWALVAPPSVHIQTSSHVVILTKRLPESASLSLPWECEPVCGTGSQQAIPALIAQRQACGTWQRCPTNAERSHKPFKTRLRGLCTERRHFCLRHRGSLRLFFLPTCGLLSVLGC